jgi:hypothetical protein
LMLIQSHDKSLARREATNSVVFSFGRRSLSPEDASLPLRHEAKPRDRHKNRYNTLIDNAS